jgi:hypothetical protein
MHPEWAFNADVAVIIEHDSSIDKGKFKFGTLFCRDALEEYGEEEVMDGRLYQLLYHFAESPECPLRQTWFSNPDTVHTIAANGDAGTAGTDKFSSSTPADGMKIAEMLADDGYKRLEQETSAVEAFKLWNVKPVIETILKAVEFIEGATKKDAVNATLVP